MDGWFPASALMSTCVCAVGEVQVGGTKERRLSIICGESCAGTTTGLGMRLLPLTRVIRGGLIHDQCTYFYFFSPPAGRCGVLAAVVLES